MPAQHVQEEDHEEEPVMHFMHAHDWDDPVEVKVMEACDEIEDYLSGLSLDEWRQKCDEFNRIQGSVSLNQIISEQFFHDCLAVLVNTNRFCYVGLDDKIAYLMNKYGIQLVCAMDNRDEYIHDWKVIDMRI